MDSRKRALEAVQRRFAVEESVAKSELIQQPQQKKNSYNNNNNNKRLHFHEQKTRNRITHNVDSSSSPSIASTSNPITDDAGASVTPSLTSSSKKGNVSFSGHTMLDDAEVNGPAYLHLPHPVHQNLLTANDKICSGSGSTVCNILHEFLQKGDSAQKYIQGTKSVKIDNWILLDNVVHSRGLSSGPSIRALWSQSKNSKGKVSMRRHKRMGSLQLPQELRKYDIFKPMHEMWKGYISQLLRHTGKNQLSQYFLNADLHGSIILVLHSKISVYTGVHGIMIRETAGTFGIITEDNKFQVVPKKVSVFVFQVDCWKITLCGDKLSMRNLGF